MLNNPFETLKAFVDQPSGTFDKADVETVADIIAKEYEELGFSVERLPGNKFGPCLICTIGSGSKVLMLMGHMDTVFPRNVYVPYYDNGDGTISGSGIIDMKGGIMVMLYALKDALPQIDLNKYTLRVVLNADEEIGSAESHDIIYENASKSFAALSFEPSAPDGRLTCARKGVTSALIETKGIPGHAGAEYTKCASAIQGLCELITRLYTLRDDSKEISFNAGFRGGGTAENVVAPSAYCKCEFRYFNQAYKEPLMEKIRKIVSMGTVPGVTATVTFGASHPACDINEKSQALIDKAFDIAKEHGISIRHEKTGGAGDISIAALAGIGVLDGFGLCGKGMHTVNEFCYKDSVERQILLSAEMIKRVCE